MGGEVIGQLEYQSYEEDKGPTKKSKKKEAKLNIDELLPINKLNYLLSNSDYIVISCPLTPLTKNMITINEIKLMKKNSILINIARSEIINERNSKSIIKSNLI